MLFGFFYRAYYLCIPAKYVTIENQAYSFCAGEIKMPGIFLQSLLIAFSGALMPGPMLTYTIEMSLKRGVRAGILIPLGHALLEAVVAIVLLTGAGRLFNERPV
jgi:hypothetical protein